MPGNDWQMHTRPVNFFHSTAQIDSMIVNYCLFPTLLQLQLCISHENRPFTIIQHSPFPNNCTRKPINTNNPLVCKCTPCDNEVKFDPQSPPFTNNQLNNNIWTQLKVGLMALPPLMFQYRNTHKQL